MTEMKNAYDGLINRLDIAEERINDLEEMLVETSQTEIQYVKQIKKQTGQNIQELWNNYQRCNLCIMGIRRREKRTEEIFEAIMTKSFQN